MDTSSTPAHRHSPWRLSARSETGFVRSANEDRMDWLPVAFGDVYVVSDGMGGYRGGALAAQLTVDTIKQSLARVPASGKDTPDAVRGAISAANEAVYQRRDPANPDTQNMGATAVLIVTSGSRFLVAHVGDSRAYLWRRRSGLECLTKDHTRTQMMIDQGLLTPEDALQHPDASVLSRAIGHSATVEVDVGAWRRIKSGEMLLLCSDGLSGYVTDSEIEALLRSGGGTRQIADALIDSALDKGGEDNVTVQLLRYAPIKPRAVSSVIAAWLTMVIVVMGLVGWAVLTSMSRQHQIERDDVRTQFEGLRMRLDQQADRLAAAEKDILALSARLPAVQTAPTNVPSIAPAGAKPQGPGPAHAAGAKGTVHGAVPTIKNQTVPEPVPQAPDAAVPETRDDGLEPRE